MTKYLLISISLVCCFIVAKGQTGQQPEEVVITSLRKKTRVQSDEKCTLQINVSPRKVRRFKAAGYVRYSDFGAVGDGETDDIDAIAAAHAFANLQGLRVRADEGATYYISGRDRTAVIQTSTDFGSAAFIIDDTEVENNRPHVFLVRSVLQPFTPEGITSLKKGQRQVHFSIPGAVPDQDQDQSVGITSFKMQQERVGMMSPVSPIPAPATDRDAAFSTRKQQRAGSGGSASLSKVPQSMQETVPGTFLVTVTDANVRRYIRYGPNQNDGSPQTDIFIVDSEGNVDMNVPIIWDFDQVTEITALPLDADTLYITGGRFTTIANQEESKYNYYHRNIAIRRSNVVVDGLEHHVTGEGDHGAPYGGFISISDCANVTVQNTLLTGHKTYETIGSAGRPVSMGSYDLSVGRALNISFINCSQTNDIDDRTFWGILGSNYCKNLLYDQCTLSRFDAHMGVANATIRNSTLGHMGINAIGTGTFTVENSTIRGRSLVNLRNDYGSTWQGEFIIRNCVFVPAGGKPVNVRLFTGYNSGQHDFGYTCYMPERITIENLHIDDSSHPEDYNGPAIFENFNREMTDDSCQEQFPYVVTREVNLRNVTTASGKELRLSDNPYMFRNVKVIRQ
ncbi:MAG: hypothetical protein P1P82_15010 [Bacteroidales bacterium]|nr:hypothetical protein [Bacteroidales bacterium]MDT8432126.1 hypothetical protein [Bacteroidales bacterium]